MTHPTPRAIDIGRFHDDRATLSVAGPDGLRHHALTPQQALQLAIGLVGALKEYSGRTGFRFDAGEAIADIASTMKVAAEGLWHPPGVS